MCLLTFVNKNAKQQKQYKKYRWDDYQKYALIKPVLNL